MIRALALLLVCQLAGETLTRSLALGVPGPVLGLLLLAIGLLIHARVTNATPDNIENTTLGRTSAALLAALGLLFVPAGVGLVQQLPLISANALAIIAALVGSTLLTLLVTVRVFLFVKKLTGKSA